MKLTKYKLNPSVIFVEGNPRCNHALTEFEINPYLKEIYKIAIDNLKPGESGEFQVVFVK